MKTIDKFFYILMPMLMLGIPLGYSTFPLCVILLLFRCITAERTTVAAFLMLYAGPTIGCIRSVYPSIPIYGMMFMIFGFLMAWKEFYGFFNKNSSGIIAMLLVFVYFYFSLYHGGFYEEGIVKFWGLINNGISSLLGFYVLFTSSRLRNIQFAEMLLIASVLMVEYLITMYGLNPGSILDFNWLREASSYIEINYERKLISYQHIGMNTAFALGVYLSKNHLTLKETFYICVLCLWFALMSGARQATLAVVVIIALRYLLFGPNGVSRFKLSYVLGIIVFIALMYNLAYYFNIDTITRTFESGDSGRMRLQLQALSVFSMEPYLGQGLGGFMRITGENYPHNFFLEILSECGLIGLLYFSVVCLIYILKNHIGIRMQSANGSFVLIMLLALGVRCMVSGNFVLSIQLFSALFALSSNVRFQKFH